MCASSKVRKPEGLFNSAKRKGSSGLPLADIWAPITISSPRKEPNSSIFPTIWSNLPLLLDALVDYAIRLCQSRAHIRNRGIEDGSLGHHLQQSRGVPEPRSLNSGRQFLFNRGQLRQQTYVAIGV